MAIMTAEEAAEAGKSLNFEKIWAALMETHNTLDRIAKESAERSKQIDAQLKETDAQLKETDAQLKETDAQLKETDAQLKETDMQIKETDAQLKETNVQIKQLSKKVDNMADNLGGLNRKFGELAEHLVAPGIAQRFNELGYHFDSISPGGQKILDEQGNALTEIDLLLENGEFIIAVEVKTEPAEKDIPHHSKRLEILRAAKNRQHDRRKILGAIAGAIFPKAVKKLVIEAGMYVIEQSGDTMKIEAPKDFKPKTW
jgi:hypothetical protein